MEKTWLHARDLPGENDGCGKTPLASRAIGLLTFMNSASKKLAYFSSHGEHCG